MPNQDQLDNESNVATPYGMAQQDGFQPITLSGEDQEHYETLKLPTNHPHTLAQALLAQLKRMPLLEEQAVEHHSEPMALLA